MTNAMPGLRNKVLLIALAAMLVFGLVAAMGVPAAQAQPYYFYMNPAATVPAPMGHDCVHDYYYDDGEITLVLGDGHYTMKDENGEDIVYTGHITSFKVNGVQKFVSTGGSTGTATFDADPGDILPVEISIDITDPPDADDHDDVSCYFKAPPAPSA